MEQRKRSTPPSSPSASPAKKLKEDAATFDDDLTTDDVDLRGTGIDKLPRRGIKLFGLDTSEEENERLQKARDQWRESLLATRTQSRKTLSLAHWKPELKHAEVETQKGKSLASMGFAKNGKVCLFPEEAVYLVDQAAMELYRDKLPLSLQECVTLMITSGVSLDAYIVYGHLKRQGYVVRRTPKPLIPPTPISSSSSSSTPSPTPSSSTPSSRSASSKQKSHTPRAKKTDTPQDNNNDYTNILNNTNNNNLSNNNNYTNNNNNTNNNNLTNNNDLTNNNNHTNNNNNTNDNGSNLSTRTLVCRNWFVKDFDATDITNYKAIKTFEVLNTYEVPEVSFDDELLYVDDVMPPLLHVNPLRRAGLNQAEILKKLQIFPVSRLGDHVVNITTKSDLFFDVYTPGSNFKKSSPGPPHYRICICNYMDTPPTLAEQQHLSSLSYPVPILYAVVDRGDVTLFTFSSRK